MLSVSIHASSLMKASPFNRLARLDIVYETLNPVADYKLSLMERNQDPLPSRTLWNYPRWSASLWDLTARGLAICLPDVYPRTEQAPGFAPGGKRCAFVRELAIVLDHVACDARNTLGTASIAQVGRRRGIYQATFDEHIMKLHRTEVFEFRPAFFRPAELLLHACMHRLTGQAELPPRPGLCAPAPVLVDGVRHIQIHQLVEPARTGFKTWLTYYSEPPAEYAGAPLGIAPHTIYDKFLSSAI